MALCHGCHTQPPFMSVFDVGQGDATRISWGRQCFWFDFGSFFQARRAKTLFEREIRLCDQHLLAVSHLDGDHVGGVYIFLDAMNALVKNVWVSSWGGDWRVKMHQKKINNRGSRLALVERVPHPQVDTLWPLEEHRGLNANELSWVLRVWHQDRRHCILLTGDISKLIETKLIETYSSPGCIFLKVAHHGSKTSTSRAFLQWAQPKIAFISNGYGHYFGHPHQTVLKNLDSHGIWIFRTDWMGRIDVWIEDQLIRVRTVKGEVHLPI